MNKIFTLSTWKMFLLIIIPPLFSNFSLGIAAMFFYAIFFLLWIYYLAQGLFEKLPEEHEMNFSKFKFHFFFPTIYFTIAIIGTGGGYSITSNNMDQYGPTTYIMIPLHIFTCIVYSIACILYQRN